MSKFKVGDKVVCVGASGSLTVGAIYTISRADSDDTYSVDNWDYWYTWQRFELAVDERQALSDAIDTVRKYGVSTTFDEGGCNYLRGHKGPLSNGQVLDRLFPPAKSPEQLEIEEVEGKLRVLADQLAILKER